MPHAGGGSNFNSLPSAALLHNTLCSVSLKILVYQIQKKVIYIYTSTLSKRQLVHGDSSTTLQRTLRARHDTHARAARRFVTFCGAPSVVALESERFLVLPFLLLLLALFALGSEDGGGEPAADVSEAS